MPSFHICTHVAGYVVEAPSEDAAVTALARALRDSTCAQPTFAHEIAVVEQIDPVRFDFGEAHLSGAANRRPSIGEFPDGVRLTHWSRDPVEAEAP